MQIVVVRMTLHCRILLPKVRVCIEIPGPTPLAGVAASVTR
jgi:hypothetical protein